MPRELDGVVSIIVASAIEDALKNAGLVGGGHDFERVVEGDLSYVVKAATAGVVEALAIERTYGVRWHSGAQSVTPVESEDKAREWAGLDGVSVPLVKYETKWYPL